jgi:hypothetical protein
MNFFLKSSKTGNSKSFFESASETYSISGIFPFHKRQQQRVLYTNNIKTKNLKKKRIKILHLYKTCFKTTTVFLIVESLTIQSYQKCTLHLASPGPSSFCDWTVEASQLFARLFSPLPASALPFLPLGSFSPFSARDFLGWALVWWGATLADNHADVLCGSSLTLALSTLAFPFASLFSLVVAVLGRWLASPPDASVFLTQLLERVQLGKDVCNTYNSAFSMYVQP